MSIRLRGLHRRARSSSCCWGIVATAGSAVPWAEGVLSLAWSEVDAVIVFSRDKPGHGIIGVGVKYRYTVAGREYTGDRYRFHSILERGHMRGRDVQMALGWYPAGERVELAVNPRDPADSVLEPGPDLANLEPFGAGL